MESRSNPFGMLRDGKTCPYSLMDKASLCGGENGCSSQPRGTPLEILLMKSLLNTYFNLV